MNVQAFSEFGARQSEAGSLRKLLKHLDIQSPDSAHPFTEPLLFGIGGGIGFAYFLFEKQGTHPIFLGTRIHTKETERPEFLQTICSRIGVPALVQNSSSASAAASNMRRNLEQGRASIVWLDAARLPYMGQLATLHSHHPVILFGEEGDQVLLSDRAPGPVSISKDLFRSARETSWSPKYRVVLLQKTEPVDDLQPAVEQGIHDCIEQMTHGLGITNFGLRGMEKWATVLTSTREKKSWLKIFPPGPELFDSLFSIYRQVRLRGNAGSAYRTLYADFLEEAAAILDRPALGKVADQFRQSERMWTELAEAHMPDEVAPFVELKRLALEQKELFETRGAEAIGEITKRKARMEQIETAVRQLFPMTLADTKVLLNDLRARILRLREHEAEAVGMLQAAMGYEPAATSQAVQTASELAK